MQVPPRLLLTRFPAQLCLDSLKSEFIAIATELPVVVACRCSPTQKADVARVIRAYTKKRVCGIGDGGNDVSMIQAADVGESQTVLENFHLVVD
jgi:magnesium-transporting ATPase (P-type)